tara:strand:- start:14 stop:580 length:567 start_codon:yes stop_codon:yes gene_type:complete
MNNLITNIDDVQAFMKSVEDLTDGNFKLYLAGGYLRDTMNGHIQLVPKDVDIMVVPTTGILDADDFQCIVNMFEKYTTISSFIDACYYIEDMVKRHVGGLVMGKAACGSEVQFIIYDEDMTQEAVSEDMDMNCNQITMDSSGHIHKTSAFVDCFKNKHIQLLHEYSEKRKISRMKRMLDKFPDFTSSM